MLHQFIKKSEKTPLNELEIARNRMKEVKDAKHSESLLSPGACSPGFAP
jgi:phage-related protein